jgi:hypothetical protein
MRKNIAGKLYYFPTPIYFLKPYFFSLSIFIQELKNKYFRNFNKSFLIYFHKLSFKYNFLYFKYKLILYQQAVLYNINLHYRWEI